MPDLKLAAAQVRELAREFVAIKEQFKNEDQQFYLDQLLGNLISGEPEPPLPAPMKGTS